MARSLFLLTLLCLPACSAKPLFKIYVSLPDRGGLVRSQENEVIPYSESKGYFCMSREHLILLIDAISQLGKKPSDGPGLFEGLLQSLEPSPKKWSVAHAQALKDSQNSCPHPSQAGE